MFISMLGNRVLCCSHNPLPLLLLCQCFIGSLQRLQFFERPILSSFHQFRCERKQWRQSGGHGCRGFQRCGVGQVVYLFFSSLCLLFFHLICSTLCMERQYLNFVGEKDAIMDASYLHQSYLLKVSMWQTKFLVYLISHAFKINVEKKRLFFPYL